jgi:hypothetical protein
VRQRFTPELIVRDGAGSVLFVLEQTSPTTSLVAWRFWESTMLADDGHGMVRETKYAPVASTVSSLEGALAREG